MNNAAEAIEFDKKAFGVGASTATIHLYVPDVDSSFKKAVAAGGSCLPQPPAPNPAARAKMAQAWE